MKRKFNENTVYVYKFFSECLPIYAFYALLFMERGQTLRHVALLIAIWNVFAIMFEIPTGVLADRVNRKKLLVVGALLKGVCFITWYVSYDFWLFATGFAVWALASCLASGTEESLVFDGLKNDGREGEFTTVYGKVEASGVVGALVGIASSGVLVMHVSIGTIALISGIISIIDALLATNISPVVVNSKVEKEEKSPFTTLKKAITFVKSNRLSRFVGLFILLIVTLGGYLDEFDALIIADFDLDFYWVTIIFMIRFAFMALGDLVAPKVEAKLRNLSQVIVVSAIGIVILGMFAYIWQPLGLVMFGIPFFILSIANVVLVGRLNHEIDEDARATILSILRTGQSVGMVIFALIFGWLAGVTTLQMTYKIIAIYGVVMCGVFYLGSGSGRMKA